MRNVLAALKSVRLALALITYIVITGIISSLVAQGRDASYYYSSFPAPLASLIIATGFRDFYGSILFFIPVFLFFANLSVCSADRFARELKKGKAGRHGPDILHLGLVLLLLGAVLGQAAKQSHPAWQGFARLGKGEAVELPNGRILLLKSLRSEKYPDGRSKDWVSTVEVSEAGKVVIPSYDIRVNHPLRMGPLSILQASYGSGGVLELAGPSDSTRSLSIGDYIDTGVLRLTLLSVDPDSGLATAREEDEKGARTVSLAKGSRVGSFTVQGSGEEELSGLQAVYDPYYPLVVAAFAVIGIGSFITFARRFGEIRA